MATGSRRHKEVNGDTIVPTGVSLTSRQMDMLDALAAARDRPRSKLIREAVELWLKTQLGGSETATT